jgi:acetyl-CoA carboxylase biotin carboxyl carrier protein
LPLSPADIKAILAALQDSDWDQAVVVIGDVEIAVARNGAPLPGAAAPPRAPGSVVTAQAPAAADAAAPAAEDAKAPAPAAVAEGHVVASPSVGVFWRAPQPGAPPFVKVGSHVKAGDTLGIVEVMKLMNNIAADIEGEVVAIHAENAGAVEFGTPLFTIQGEGR